MAVVDCVILLEKKAPVLAELVGGLQRQGARHVLVVDHGGRASRADVAAAELAGAQVLRQRRGGEGAAVQLALRHLLALPEPPELVAFFAPDGRDRPEALPALCRPLAEGHFDLAVGSRVLADAPLSLSERTGVLVAVNTIHALYGHRYTDVSTLRVVRLPALVAMGLDDPSAGVWGEMLVKAVRRGLRIAEVPVPAPARATSERPWRQLERGGRTLWHALRHAMLR
jgi:hypothetical protein